MAIMLEQKHKETNWTLVIGVFVVVLILFISSYYLFFKKPEVIEELVNSAGQKELETLSQVKPEYSNIITTLNKVYKKTDTVQIVQPQLGRKNPFQPL